MIRIGDVEYSTLDDLKDRDLGPVGTPERDEYERELRTALVGDAIKQMRKEQKLTQKELAERLGVRPAQISKIESGRNLTFNTFFKVCSAIGIQPQKALKMVASLAL